MFLRIFFVSWLSLVAISIVSEMHTQWAPVSQKYATQHHWVSDCKNAAHWEKYTDECKHHTGMHYPSFWTQWFDAVLRNVRWCGVDRCESVFTFKGILVGFLVMSVFQAGPVLAHRGWDKFNNE